MAGAGTKLFVAGDVLTAAEVNTYLQDQVIMRFANSAARSAAFGGAGEPVLAEGMFTYLLDTNAFEVYDGSAFVPVDTSVDTSKIPLATVTTKGDLIAGTGNATVTRIGAGTNGFVLSANSAQASGLQWIAAAAGADVLQVQVFS